METFDAIRTVLAVREYSDQPVPDETIEKIVKAAHLTASSQNKQPWHFIVVQNRETLRKLADLSPSGPYVADAALAVVVLVKATPPAISDASRAIQSMVLAAWSDGVGSNWVGSPGSSGERYEAMKELLGVPDDLQFAAIVPFGYPAKAVGKGKKKRKPFGEVVSGEKYGTPFAGA